MAKALHRTHKPTEQERASERAGERTRLAKYTMNSIENSTKDCVYVEMRHRRPFSQRANVRDKEGQQERARATLTQCVNIRSLSLWVWLGSLCVSRWMDKNKFMELILMVLSCCVYFFAIISCRLTVVASGSLYSSLIQRRSIRSFVRSVFLRTNSYVAIWCVQHFFEFLFLFFLFSFGFVFGFGAVKIQFNNNTKMLWWLKFFSLTCEFKIEKNRQTFHFLFNVESCCFFSYIFKTKHIHVRHHKHSGGKKNYQIFDLCKIK